MKQRKQVHFDSTSSDFDGIVNLGNESMTMLPGSVFRGLLQASPEQEMVITFPTASQLIAACPAIPCNHYCKRFSIRNDGRAAITIAPGTGGTINGSSTVSASAYAAHYCLRFTSVTSGVESYQIVRE